MMTYIIPDEHVETIENAIDAVDDLEDVEVNRSPGRLADGQVSKGEALAMICEAYTGWSS